jgi:hypothetical protein
MNYGILNTLNGMLQKIQQDAVVVGLTIASLMIVIYSIMILFDTDTSVTAHAKRWDNLRKVFFIAFFIASAGALVSSENDRFHAGWCTRYMKVSFGQQLGNSLHV